MTYAVLEAANGELLIETLSKDYDSQPVPLGTEFKCVGGYGSPPLGHGWTLSDNDWFDVFLSTSIRDNLSATHHAQWVGPKHTFTDQPVNGLVIKGDRLIIPTDDRYRGMSYAYTCWGNNSFENKVWSVRKTIHFTVMICPTRFVPLDLTVLLSSRLLSRCTLEGNPDREIQFYGHFYLRLIQQLIMGLPHGPTQTQFHFIRDDIFSHNASDSLAFTAFTKQLSREQLLRAVNPNGTKPKTNPVGCGALPIIVDSVIRHLVALHHFPLPGREYVLLLPFDDFTDTRITNETKSLLSVLLQSNLSTVLASTVGQGVHGSVIIHTLEELFSTTRTINLLPNFSGDTHCLKCRPRLEAETLRIARDELFDTICETTGITRPDSCPAPTLRFAIPTRHWYSGLQLGVTCIADLSRPYRGQTATGVAICLTNGTMLKELERDTPNLQQLMKACIQELANDVTRSISAPNEFSVSAQLKLQNKDDESSHLMCYQRQGDTDPQVTDVVNYATVPLSVPEPYWHMPKLSIKWPQFETEAALLACLLNGYAPASEVLMLLTVNATEPLKIVARKKVALNPLGDVVNVHLGWLELWPPSPQAKLFCLVRPISIENQWERVISGKLSQSELVRLSQPMAKTHLPSNCPNAPNIWTEPPTNNELLPQTSRLHVRCEGMVTTHGHPLKMYYLTSNFSLVICAVEGKLATKEHVVAREANLSQWMVSEHSCILVTTEDRTCSQPIGEQEYWLGPYYQTSCVVKIHPSGLEVFRSIKLTIKQLRHIDFMAVSFCRTVDLHLTSVGQRKQDPDLTSDLINVRFQLPTQITQFFFKPDEEVWFCETYSFPLSQQSGTVKVLHASPRTLEKQLRLYKTRENRTQPTLKDPRLAAGKIRLQLNYYSLLIFQPQTQTHGRLRRGEAILRCVFQSLYRDLRTRVGAAEVEPVIQRPEILSIGEAMEIDCEMRPQLDMVRTALHRLIHYTWLHYDLCVAMFPLMHRIKHRLVRSDTQPTAKLLGPVSGFARNLSVSLLMDEDVNSIVVQPVSEFDSAEYFCTGMTLENTTLRSHTIKRRILGKSKHVSFGIRLQGVRNLWAIASPPAKLGQVAQFRCSVWSTNPAGRKIAHFQVSTAGQSEELHNERLRVLHPHGVVLGEICAHVTVTSVNFVNDFVCHFADDTITTNKTIRPARTDCGAPEVEWSPSGRKEYGVHDSIYCEARGGCEHAAIRWIWVAGPIPQIGPESYDNVQTLSSLDNRLSLLQLNRSGHYVFRCIATCECSYEKRSTSVTVTIYVNVMRENGTGGLVQNPQADRSCLSGVTSTNELTGFDEPYGHRQLISHSSLVRSFQAVTADKVESNDIWSVDVLERLEQINTLDDHMDEVEDKTIPDELRAPSSFQTEKRLNLLPSPKVHIPRVDQSELSDFSLCGTDHRTQFRKIQQATRKGHIETAASAVHYARTAEEEDTTERQAFDADLRRPQSDLHPPVVLFAKGHFTVAEQLRAPHLRRHAHALRSAYDDGYRLVSRLENMREDIQGELPAIEAMTRSERLGDIRMTAKLPRVNRSSIYSVLSTWSKERAQEVAFAGNLRSVDVLEQSDIHADALVRPTQSSHSSRHLVWHLANKWDISQQDPRKRIPYSDIPSSLELPYEPSRTAMACELSQSDHERRVPLSLDGRNMEPDRQRRCRSRDVDYQLESTTPDVQINGYRRQLERGITRMKRYPEICYDQADRASWSKSERKFDRQSGRFRWDPLGRQHSRQSVTTTHTKHWCRHARLDTDDSEDGLSTADLEATIPAGLHDIGYAWTTHGDISQEAWYNARSQSIKHLIPWRLENQESDVILEFSLIVLPVSVSARCPQLDGGEFSAYRPLQITWIRQPYAPNPQPSDVEQLVQFSLVERRVRILSGRGNISERLFIYPERKWPSSHTLDIGVVAVDDYGFYGCTTTLQPLRPRGELINVSKISSTPLCIIPTIIRPVATIDRMRNGTAASTNKCLSEGDEFLIRCAGSRMQLFCEQADSIAHGYRSMHSRLSAYLHLLTSSKSYRVIQLNSDLNSFEQLNVYKNHIVKIWKMTATTLLRDAYVTCVLHPELAIPPMGRPAYWSRLEDEFALRQRQLSRRSRAVHICVDQGGDVLNVYPSPLNGKLTLRFGQPLTCVSIMPGSEPPMVTIYPISNTKAHSAVQNGPVQRSRWMDAVLESP
ncbi:unnamed protein product, partial [Dicrocoelium dendriticum]